MTWKMGLVTIGDRVLVPERIAGAGLVMYKWLGLLPYLTMYVKWEPILQVTLRFA